MQGEDGVRHLARHETEIPGSIYDINVGYFVYNAVKRVNDIYSEGITEDEAITSYGNELEYSDTGLGVRVLHYVLGVISFFDQDLPSLESVVLGDEVFQFSLNTVFEGSFSSNAHNSDLPSLRTIELGFKALMGCDDEECRLSMKSCLHSN